MDLDIQYQYRKDDVTKSSPTGEHFKTSDINQLRQKLETLPETAQIVIQPYSPTKDMVIRKRRFTTVLHWKKAINGCASEGCAWEDAFKNAFCASGYVSASDDEDDTPFIPDDTEYYSVYCIYSRG